MTISDSTKFEEIINENSVLYLFGMDSMTLSVSDTTFEQVSSTQLSYLFNLLSTSVQITDLNVYHFDKTIFSSSDGSINI